MPGWYSFKLFLEHSTGFDMDALHVLAGVILQLLAAAALGRSVARWLPWLMVLGAELLNEVSDLYVEQWPQPAMQYGEGMKDILLTMILPTLLLLLCRWRPALFVRG